MDEVRHCAPEIRAKAGQLAFRQYLIKGQAECGDNGAVEELSRKVVDAKTDWDVL